MTGKVAYKEGESLAVSAQERQSKFRTESTLQWAGTKAGKVHVRLGSWSAGTIVLVLHDPERAGCELHLVGGT